MGKLTSFQPYQPATPLIKWKLLMGIVRLCLRNIEIASCAAQVAEKWFDTVLEWRPQSKLLVTEGLKETTCALPHLLRSYCTNCKMMTMRAVTNGGVLGT